MFSSSESFQFIISAVLMAMVGGVANFLMSDRHSVFQFIVAVFLAGFAGFLVGQLCIEYEISESVAFFLCGSAGLCGELILKLARKAVIQKMAYFTDQNLDNELDMIEKEYLKRKKEVIQKRSDLLKED
jgi:hypothetical protein